MFRFKLHLRDSSLALCGLLLAAAPLLAQGTGSSGGVAPAGVPGMAPNGAQPGGSGSGFGTGLTGYGPSYGTPGTGGYGYQTGAGLGGPAQPYRVPSGYGTGAAGYGVGQNATGYGAITSVFGDTGLGAGGRSQGQRGLGIGGLRAGYYGGTGRGNYSSFNRYGRTSTGITLDVGNLPSRPGQEENVAHLRVILPSKDAELWVNGTRMAKKGAERTFISPILTPGKRFIYDFQVRWKDKQGRWVEQSRSVPVHAGFQDVVDFTRPEVSEQKVSQLGRELGLARGR